MCAMTLKTPDLTSVRTLITSATYCANHCGVSVPGVYRWIKVNRIPGKYLTKICNLYNCEIRDMLHLTGSEKSNGRVIPVKPKHTLETILQVYLGKMTLQEAAATLQISEKSIKATLTNWGDELPTLYTTLSQLDEKRISLAEACQRLKIKPYTLHDLRRKYGYAPGRVKRTRPVSGIEDRRIAQKNAALDVVAGRVNLKQAGANLNMSQQTILRAVDQLTKTSLHTLTHWPNTFRLAFAEELDTEETRHVEKWVEFATTNKLYLQKRPKYPATPDTWREATVKRMLIAVLLDEEPLDSIAASRKADPVILEGLFTNDLAPLGLTFEQVRQMPVIKQAALAELLLAVMDRRRRID